MEVVFQRANRRANFLRAVYNSENQWRHCGVEYLVVAEEKEDEKKRGPRGGIKHTPGRGHDTKSGPLKKDQFRKRAAKKRQAKEEELRRQWEEWDSLPPEVQRLLPDKKPKLPRPEDEK